VPGPIAVTGVLITSPTDVVTGPVACW
jgi:hypothetical protein